MRVAPLLIFLVIVLAAVGGALWFFGGPEGVMKTFGGFGKAQTPTEAMEKFRDAIQKRKYKWAANYCTKEYAEVLVKSDAKASQLGDLLDKISEYMDGKKLRTDQTTLLFNLLDPFPANFKVQGAVKENTDKISAVGNFSWDNLPMSGNVNVINPNWNLDGKMYSWNLMPANLIGGGAVKIVKEADEWKLQVDNTPAFLDANRYFLDHCDRYIEELKTFRTYMMNGRYDSGKAFEGEVLDALRKAAK